MFEHRSSDVWMYPSNIGGMVHTLEWSYIRVIIHQSALKLRSDVWIVFLLYLSDLKYNILTSAPLYDHFNVWIDHSYIRGMVYTSKLQCMIADEHSDCLRCKSFLGCRGSNELVRLFDPHFARDSNGEISGPELSSFHKIFKGPTRGLLCFQNHCTIWPSSMYRQSPIFSSVTKTLF